AATSTASAAASRARPDRGGRGRAHEVGLRRRGAGPGGLPGGGRGLRVPGHRHRATGKPYQEVYDELNALAAKERPSKRRPKKSSARTGVHIPTCRAYLASLGWEWVPTMRVGSGCTVHLVAAELPPGRLLVSVSKHLVAVIDGVVHDTH